MRHPRLPFPQATRRLVVFLWLAVRLIGQGCDDPGVRIIEERQGDTVSLFVESTNCLDITITLNADLVNMHPTVVLPLTVETRGRPRVELVQLQAGRPGQPWSYQYKHHWQYGSRAAQPDDTVHALPFAGHHRVRQGYRGSFSHRAGSPNENALDWDMPEGTAVLATRDGIVVGVRQDSDSGGPHERFKQCSNYIVLRHADGTYSEYLHLKRGGARVTLGDEIKAGQLIALSGNTGWTTRPHLHFAVFRAVDGYARETLPVQFRLKDGSIHHLREGRTY